MLVVKSTAWVHSGSVFMWPRAFEPVLQGIFPRVQGRCLNSPTAHHINSRKVNESGDVMINSGERGFGLPKFSHAERERRWSRVRELMRQKQLDAIIGFPNQSHWDQFQADIRYLTHIGGHQTEVAVVFPLSSAVTAFVRGGNEVEWWSIAQDWLTDIRASRRSWGEPMID